jgi:alpha-1,2-mannosyltransferase
VIRGYSSPTVRTEGKFNSKDSPRIAICHDNLNFSGGAERVCLGFLLAAKNLGFSVDLITVAKTSWSRLERAFGMVKRPDREYSLFESGLPLDHYYGRFLFVPFALSIIGPCSMTINTKGYRWLPIRCDIVYEHTPPFFWPNVAKGSSVARRIYFTPYSIIGRWMLRALNSSIITNSHYCATNIEQLTGRKACVVYPPVNVEEFGNDDSSQRRNLVITCGRFSQEKNYEFLIQVADQLRQLEFLILGSYARSLEVAYFKKIVAMVKERRLTNVTLMTNVASSIRSEMYKKASVYLHTMEDEDFGIAIVEAMSAGVLPVVHKSAGPWLDIIEEGKFGFGYTDLNSAVEAVTIANTTRGKMSHALIERAKMFAKEQFEAEARRILLKVWEGKDQMKSLEPANQIC